MPRWRIVPAALIALSGGFACSRTPAGDTATTPVVQVEPDADSLIPKIAPVCENAVKNSERTSPKLPADSVAANSVLVVMRREGSATWEAAHGAPLFGEAHTATDVRHVACVVHATSTVGHYLEVGTGRYAGAAYAVAWVVRLMTWPEGRVIGQTTLTSENPPRVKRPGHSGEASRPSAELSAWLAPALDSSTVLRHKHTVSQVAFSPDGRIIAAATNSYSASAKTGSVELARFLWAATPSAWRQTRSRKCGKSPRAGRCTHFRSCSRQR